MCFADDCTTTEPIVQTDYCRMDFDFCLRDPMHSIDMSFIYWLNSSDPENAPNYVNGSIDNAEHSVASKISVDDNNNFASDLSALASLIILDGLSEIDVQSEEIAETISNIREITCKFDFEKDGGVADVDAAAFRKRSKSSRRRYSRRVVVSKVYSDSDYDSLNDSNLDTSGKSENEEFSCNAWRRERPFCPSSPLQENIERSKSGRRSKNTPRSVTVKENSETASTPVVSSRDAVYCCSAEGCGKIYRRRSHLQAHSRRHTGERPFHCEWKGCQWKFSRSDELVRHHRSHSGEKPFICQLCDKRFARSDHLKKHTRIHTRPCYDKSP